MEREELAALGENSSSVPRTNMVTQNLQLLLSLASMSTACTRHTDIHVDKH